MATAINDSLYENFRSLIYSRFGIQFSAEKREVLEPKLQRLAQERGLALGAYYQLLASGNSDAHSQLASVITINKTDFFREPHHFEFVVNHWSKILAANPRIQRNKELRVWSAGCSSGEEPYTLAMVLKEHLATEVSVRILATDLSPKVLSVAQQATYPSSILDVVPANYRGYFHEQSGAAVQVKQEIKDMVTFRLFNLMNPFPFANTFDLIFCRNVMIYFDSLGQSTLVRKFYTTMQPGGYLFIGHSESLTQHQHLYRYIQPTIYQRR